MPQPGGGAPVTAQLLLTADALYDAGRYEEAASAYQQALTAGADEAAARYGLAISAAAQGLMAEAAAQYRAVLQLQPGHANAAYQLGLLAERGGDVAQALRWYRQCLVWQPEHYQAQRGITRLSDNAQPAVAATSTHAPGQPAPAHTAAPPAPPAAPPPQHTNPDPSPRRTLAEELASNGFNVDTIHHGDLLSARHGRLLRSYLGWFIAPALVFAVAYLPQPLVNQAGSSAVASAALAQLQLVARSLSWPLLTCVVGLALLSWLTTIHWVYERRIDVLTGILRRRQQSLWLYEISRAPRYQQSLLQQLTGTGTIIIDSEALPTRLGLSTGQAKMGSLRLHSLAPINEVKQLTEILKTRQLFERRAMLDRFIGR